jgi:FKBP-type peptidyl-prolyl cis-trans isomerase FkpA
MKKIIILSTCFSMLAAVSFAQKPAPKKNPVEDTIQYSLGVYMMQQFFAKTGFVVNDPVLFTKAINDVLGKKKLMVDPATTQDRLLAYQRTYQLQKGATLEKMLFDKVRAEKGFTELPGTGVFYSLAKSGTGIRPAAKDTIIVNVICTLPDGTVVDDTNKTKQSYMALAGEMIPGLREILYRVGEGSIFRAILPARTAYGEVGTNNIPPNSAVIYDVALVSVKPAR